MESISNAEAALLGILKDGPMYPYQIEKEVQQRDMRFWTGLSMSSIYKLLQKLEKRGIVSSEVEISEANRTRKRYRMTDAGRKAFIAKIKQLVSEPEHMRWQVDIGISNLDALSIDQAVASLENYRKELTKKLKNYYELVKYMKETDCPMHNMGLAYRPIYLIETEIRWVNSYIEQIREKEEK